MAQSKYSLIDGHDGVVIANDNGTVAFIPNDPDEPSWQAYQEWTTAGNAALPYVPPGGAGNPTDNLKLSKRAEIDAAYTEATAVLSAGYPENEQKTWPVQILEAAIVLDGGSDPTPWIDAASTAREITREDMAQRIRVMDTQYREISGALSGKRQSLTVAIDAVVDGPGAAAAIAAILWGA